MFRMLLNNDLTGCNRSTKHSGGDLDCPQTLIDQGAGLQAIPPVPHTSSSGPSNLNAGCSGRQPVKDD